MKEKRKTHPAVKVLCLLIPIAVIAALLFLYGIVGVRFGSETEYGAVYRTYFQGQPLWQWYVFDRTGNILDSGIDEEIPYLFDDGTSVYVILSSAPTFREPMYDAHEEYIFCYQLDTGEISFPDTAPRPDFCGLTKFRYFHPRKVETSTEFVEILDFTQEHTPCFVFTVTDKDGKELYSSDSEAIPEVTWQDAETLIVTPVWEGEPQPLDFDPYAEHF